MTPEATLKAAVVKTLNDLLREPEFYLRLNSGKVRVKGGYMQLCAEGTADFIVFLQDRAFWIELKAVGCRTKKEREAKQAEFRDKVSALGHEYRICWSVDDVIAMVGR